MGYLDSKEHIHFIAIGGIGMSALARVLLKMGYRISGSDLRPNALTDMLKKEGAEIYAKHDKENLAKDVDLVVYSSCILPDNPEMKEAKCRGITAVTRGIILAELMSQREGIAVCGSHGKTTTSGMIATLLTSAGRDPMALIGGEVEFLGSNARWGAGKYLVAEADESDGSFLKLRPMYSVITNIDEDHMDYFKDTKSLIRCFRRYIKNIKDGGCLVYSTDDPRLFRIKKMCSVDSINFGLSLTADIFAKNIISRGYQTIFDCYKNKKSIGHFKICVPGIHNVSNALAAICVGFKLSLDPDQMRAALEKFTGTKRRFQMKGTFGGITVVEDYAHHPTEIAATLKAAGAFRPKRVIGVFQPHRFTRTLNLADRFAGCFANSDYLILTDIYSASEESINGVTGRLLYEKVVASGHKSVVYLNKSKITKHILGIAKPGDMIIILGAGDINTIADELTKEIKPK